MGMVWDYLECNAFSGSTGDWRSSLKYNLKVISNAFMAGSKPSFVKEQSAVTTEYSADYFDAIITDPPYYDSVPYSYLSDFFYVWLKRSLADIYPDLFATPLTPKAEEIVAYSHGEEGFAGGKKYFEDGITRAFQEIYRVLKPTGIACIVFAHKSTDAWETIINALFRSGLYLTASWPLHTEMKARLRASESAALASSIYMVCRKRTKERTAYFKEIKQQIQDRVKEKLEQFWNEGIEGGDLFISAIGPAMEVFGKYTSVEKLSGDPVSAKELLQFVRETVSEYALTKILKDSRLGSIDEETRFYLIWRWTYNSAKVPYDDARKIANAIGIELNTLWDNGFVKKDKEFISVLDAQKRGRKFLEKKDPGNMIDVLHTCLIYWELNDRKSIARILESSGNQNNEMFWRTVQAISEVLPDGNKEKQMLQGFFYGRQSYARANGQKQTEFKME